MTAHDDGLPPLREVISAHGLRADKRLGQNFLLDLNLTRKIARSAAPLSDAHIYEIGPGPGGLTRALLMEGAMHVTVIERDPRCLPALAEIGKAYPGRLSILHGDALDTYEDMLATQARGRFEVVANLPYNVGTALLVKWLTFEEFWPPWYHRATLLFQREVAERIVAKPGSSAYGRLSVLTAWRANAHILFDIPAAAFTPPPKVTSSLVQVTPLPAPRFPATLSALETVTAAAFGQRRKMLRAALKSVIKEPIPLLESAGIPETARAEEIDIEGFCALAREFAAHSQS